MKFDGQKLVVYYQQGLGFYLTFFSNNFNYSISISISTNPLFCFSTYIPRFRQDLNSLILLNPFCHYFFACNSVQIVPTTPCKGLRQNGEISQILRFKYLAMKLIMLCKMKINIKNINNQKNNYICTHNFIFGQEEKESKSVDPQQNPTSFIRGHAMQRAAKVSQTLQRQTIRMKCH